MSIFGQLFDVFSGRPEAASKPAHTVPETTRTRILMWCRELFANQRYNSGFGVGDDYTQEFWQEIHRLIRFRRGRFNLSQNPRSEVEDAIHYIMTCPCAHFLDFLEDVFRVECYFHVRLPAVQAIEELNDLLRRDDLPYFVTGFVREAGTETFYGQQHEVTRTVVYPKVVMRDSEILHSQAIKPVLELLQHPDYRNANSEYLAALEDYRKNDFGDCLTKCGSAFESVLKIICHRKGWPYKQSDTAGQLVQTFIKLTKLEPYFDPMLMATAVLRNKLSASHGAGAQAKQIPRHLALYGLNVTASAILFVAQEAA